MEYFTQQLINGLALGSICGLIAIGYTLVYGSTGKPRCYLGGATLIIPREHSYLVNISPEFMTVGNSNLNTALCGRLARRTEMW
jgi:hypothetical protein